MKDNPDEMFVTQRSFERQNDDVGSGTTVQEAIKLIGAERFDVLLTDLHMPEPGAEAGSQRLSGLTRVISAILLEPDEVLVKPSNVKQLAELIDTRLLASNCCSVHAKEGVASILERELAILTQRWLSWVEKVQELAAIPLTAKERTAYLPRIIRSVTERLSAIRETEVIDSPCAAAVAHGQLRSSQGCTPFLTVQESRILQVCIFETIERSLSRQTSLPRCPTLVIIADEVNS